MRTNQQEKLREIIKRREEEKLKACVCELAKHQHEKTEGCRDTDTQLCRAIRICHEHPDEHDYDIIDVYLCATCYSEIRQGCMLNPIDSPTQITYTVSPKTLM